MGAAASIAGPSALDHLTLTERLRTALEDTSAGDAPAAARAGALAAVKGLAEGAGAGAEPYIVPLLSAVLERLGDK